MTTRFQVEQHEGRFWVIDTNPQGMSRWVNNHQTIEAANKSAAALEYMHAVNAIYQKHLHAIRQLTMSGWLALAKELQVATNDREHAAKVLALREYAAA